MVRVLLLVPYPPGTAPANRYRIEPFIGYLTQHGYAIDYSFVLSPEAYRVWYSRGHYFTKGWTFLKSHVYRWAETLIKARKIDLVWVQREALLGPTSYFERWWAKRKPLLYDFDDSIWLKDVSRANRLFAWLKRPEKTADIIQAAAVVTVCNAYLEAYVRQFHERVLRIPTVIDTEKYPLLPPNTREEVVIGWSGSYTTEKHLRTIEPVLLALQKKYGARVRFRFIGVPQYWPQGLRGESLPWHPDTEVADLSAIDIGLMPLPDDAWTRGKCGLKALQYMALGRPAVVSPISINCEIVQDGYNGYLAATFDEWIDKLSDLIENPDKRHQMGLSARQTVEGHYSVLSNRDKYIQAFQWALQLGPQG